MKMHLVAVLVAVIVTIVLKVDDVGAVLVFVSVGAMSTSLQFI